MAGAALAGGVIAGGGAIAGSLIGASAGKKAAQAQAAADLAGIAEQRRQFDTTTGNVQPFLDAGVGALPLVQEGLTAEGLDARLARLMNTNTFGSLVDERTRSVEGQLAAGGLTRSGTALQSIAAIPTDLALALEDMLTGRATNLAGSGQNAALGLGSLGAGSANSISSLLSSSGRARGSGILSDSQALSGLIQNSLNAGAKIFSDFDFDGDSGAVDLDFGDFGSGS